MEPMEQTCVPDPPGGPAGESRGDASEHPPVVSSRAALQSDTRGRQRDVRQRRRRRADNRADFNTDKLWQMKGAQREVCPAPVHGTAVSRCPNAAPDADNHRKNGEDRALQESLNQVQVPSLLIDSDAGYDARLGKKRHRRRTSKKKRNWKPYNKLSWEEKKALEEKETLRASRMREEMFAKGLPVAPYNTTQFLMDEHDREEPDLNTEAGARRCAGVAGRTEETGSEEEPLDNEEEDEDDGSGGGSDGIGRPGNAGGEFLQRDFSETYEMYHVETLQNMSKQELVQEYLELEKCMSRLEEENNRLRRALEPEEPEDGAQVRVRLREMEQEVERLRAENSELHLQGKGGDKEEKERPTE